MYPNLFGIPDFSYTLCILVGIALAFLVGALYFKKKQITKKGITDLLICGCFGIVFGIVFAVLFENLYEAIALGESYKWSFKMTFLGGLFGGVVAFIITYYVMKKVSVVNFNIIDAAVIAPACVLVAHGFGRIGCFMAGCCYGVPTDSWIGINFPEIGKVVPTQLIEAIILFILFAIVAILTFKFDFKYSALIYLGGYGIARFVIEFFRGDERGVALALSPSQIWCILLILAGIPVYFWLKSQLNKNEKE